MASKIVHIPKWLFIILTLVLFLRIPSFFEPYSYGDEMIYLTLGEGIRQGIPLYKNLHDNKPPLLYITAAVAGSLFWFKVILAGWMIATIVVFWRFIEKLFSEKQSLHKIATLIFALLTTLPLLEGNTVNAELFMIGPTIAAFYILLFSRKNRRNLLFSGFLFSISTLFKMPALFDILTIVAFWLIYLRFKKSEVIFTFKNLLLIFLGFIIPILLTVFWYMYRGAFSEYLVAAFLQNIGYLSSWSGKAASKTPFIIKNSSLLIKFGLVILGNIILFLKKKSLSKEFIFLVSWTLFASFAVALSERPYPHYFVQVIAPVSILLGLLLTDKTPIQTLSIIPLTIAFFVPFYYRFWYYPTSPYYLRFVNFTLGRLSRDSYLNSFNPNLSLYYEIAEIVDKTTKREDRIFVWGDSSLIYALSRRLPPIKYVADYHIKDFYSPQKVYQDLIKTPPVYIIILPEASPFPELRQLLPNRYLLLSQINGAEVWHLMTPKIRSAIITDSF